MPRSKLPKFSPAMLEQAYQAPEFPPHPSSPKEPPPMESQSTSTPPLSESKSPSSSPTTTPQATQGVTGLPPPKRTYKPRTAKVEKIADAVVATVKPGKRTLPDDPDEFEKATRRYRIMAKPMVHGISKVYEVAEMEKLSSDELDGGIEAMAALFYQEGGEFDARFLMAMWLLGTLGPRLGKKLATRKKSAPRTAGGQALPEVKPPQEPRTVEAKAADVVRFAP